MGCDGGTIPTRDELVRLKKKPEKKDKDADLAAKWQLCALSQEPLQLPIVSCELGKLYNKDTVIEFLLDRSKFVGGANAAHIRGLKDIKTLQLSENPDLKKTKQADKGDVYIDRSAARYICPVTGLEMSGRYRFCFLYRCGCVFSERAFKEVKAESCHTCGSAFDKDDIIILNGTEEDVETLRARMEERRQKAKLTKKSKKKQKVEAAGSASAETEDGPSSSKQAKLETSQSGPSKQAKSKLTNGAAGGPSKLTSVKAGDKPKNIQEDPRASSAYKSLFTTCEKARNQPKAHWVTHNPCYY